VGGAKNRAKKNSVKRRAKRCETPWEKQKTVRKKLHKTPPEKTKIGFFMNMLYVK
jgi:hypothetical protein